MQEPEYASLTLVAKLPQTSKEQDQAWVVLISCFPLYFHAQDKGFLFRFSSFYADGCHFGFKFG